MKFAIGSIFVEFKMHIKKEKQIIASSSYELTNKNYANLPTGDEERE